MSCDVISSLEPGEWPCGWWTEGGFPCRCVCVCEWCAHAHACGAAPLGLRGLAYRQQSLICSLKRQSQGQLKQFGNSEAHFLVQDPNQ